MSFAYNQPQLDSGGTGLVHKLKDAFFHGEKHLDLEHETALKKFATLYQTLLQIKTHVAGFIASLNGILADSHATAADFDLLLGDASAGAGGTPNPYQSLVAQWRKAHLNMNAEQRPLANELTEKVLKPVDECLIEFAPLHQRIAQRHELHQRLEYYLNKVTNLKNDRDERLVHAQTEKTTATEKMDRNARTLDAISTEYQLFASKLMADLQNAWTRRVSILGPVMASFIRVEKHFTEVFVAQFAEMQVVEQLQTAPRSTRVDPVTATEMPVAESIAALQRPMLPTGGYITEKPEAPPGSTLEGAHLNQIDDTIPTTEVAPDIMNNEAGTSDTAKTSLFEDKAEMMVRPLVVADMHGAAKVQMTSDSRTPDHSAPAGAPNYTSEGDGNDVNSADAYANPAVRVRGSSLSFKDRDEIKMASNDRQRREHDEKGATAGTDI